MNRLIFGQFELLVVKEIAERFGYLRIIPEEHEIVSLFWSLLF